VLVRGWTAAPSTEQSDIELSRILADLLPGTVQGLEQTDGVGTGHDGTYLVTWSDAVHIGSQGYGLVNELERRGYHVGVVPAVAVPATSHRVLLDDQATARVTLATGAWVERWRALPGATEVAFVDPRTPEQRARFEDLHDQARTELVAEGLDDLVARLDGHLFEVAIDPRVPFDTESKLSEMLDLGVPTAVFLGPVDVQPADTLP